jgi:hypothetical protein
MLATAILDLFHPKLSFNCAANYRLMLTCLAPVHVGKSLLRKRPARPIPVLRNPVLKSLRFAPPLPEQPLKELFSYDSSTPLSPTHLHLSSAHLFAIFCETKGQLRIVLS